MRLRDVSYRAHGGGVEPGAGMAQRGLGDGVVPYGWVLVVGPIADERDETWRRISDRFVANPLSDDSSCGDCYGLVGGFEVGQGLIEEVDDAGQIGCYFGGGLGCFGLGQLIAKGLDLISLVNDSGQLRIGVDCGGLACDAIESGIISAAGQADVHGFGLRGVCGDHSPCQVSVALGRVGGDGVGRRDRPNDAGPHLASEHYAVDADRSAVLEVDDQPLLPGTARDVDNRARSAIAYIVARVIGGVQRAVG